MEEELKQQKKRKNKKQDTKKTVSQREIAKEIAQELNTTIDLVEKIIDLEQRKTMDRVKKGCTVVKKNYLTIKPYQTKEKLFHSALTGKDYIIEAKSSIRVTVGAGFLSYISENRPMKDKLCRFVDKK